MLLKRRFFFKKSFWQIICMGGEKTDFAVLFKAQEALAMKNSIQFWLAHFKSDTK